MGRAELEDLATLADPTRARILRLIRDSDDGRMLVGRLAEQLALRQPTVSHHMKALHADGLVVREPEGRRVWYSIAPTQADRIDALLGADTRFDAAPDLDRISDDLSLRFRGVFSPQTVRAAVEQSRELLAQAGATASLSSRTAAFAATRLEALRRSADPPTGTPTVLFVCVQNAGRSQMAAGILRQLAGDAVRVQTAGSAPAGDIRHTVVGVLDEIGVAIGDEYPKPLTDEVVRAADVVVTMGCGDACPVYPGRRYLDWELDDPAGKPVDEVRAIRDEVDARVRGLLDELLVDRSPGVSPIR
ncbi:metalloregulator ArsR/SmtB family transcription factor [Microbacterium sp. Root180]|uniref:metalloregulator ArsR/SmtB family transcription factor n=1 Tax=Microbacterium sp. Root180 TaxID=1736483 RepID=UPI0009E92F3A|nr:metalloregulator ArsR/SmtB family transcription factor [Microbacterium sp. Root180]